MKKKVNVWVDYYSKNYNRKAVFIQRDGDVMFEVNEQGYLTEFDLFNLLKNIKIVVLK